MMRRRTVCIPCPINKVIEHDNGPWKHIYDTCVGAIYIDDATKQKLGDDCVLVLALGEMSYVYNHGDYKWDERYGLWNTRLWPKGIAYEMPTNIDLQLPQSIYRPLAEVVNLDDLKRDNLHLHYLEWHDVRIYAICLVNGTRRPVDEKLELRVLLKTKRCNRNEHGHIDNDGVVVTDRKSPLKKVEAAFISERDRLGWDIMVYERGMCALRCSM